MITLVLFRNKQYLNKYNKISDPNALWTWEQFIKRCREKCFVKRKDGHPIVIFVLNSRGRELLVIRH